MNKVQTEALRNWTQLNAVFMLEGRGKLTIEQLTEMLNFEKSKNGQQRNTFIKRLKQRINGLVVEKYGVGV